MYFTKNETYYIVIELKVFYKTHNELFFVAENMLVQFKPEQGYQNYNDDQKSQQCILNADSKVQFFEYPKNPRDMSDSSTKE